MTKSRRLRVDEVLAELDVLFLQRKGFLGTRTPWRVKRDGQALTMQCEVREDGESRSLEFCGAISPGDGDPEQGQKIFQRMSEE